MSETIEHFDHCYICDKKLTQENFSLLRLPTEDGVICLCEKCSRQFRKQAKLHKKIIHFNEKEFIRKLNNNEINVSELFKEQLLKLSYTHKIWLDKQRRTYAEGRNKGKN